MRNEIPQDMQICMYVRGEGENNSLFITQSPLGYEPAPYASFGCDDDGIFLVTEDGDVTRVEGEAGFECYEHSEGCAAVLLQMLDSNGDFHSEYLITRLARDNAMAIGA